jgi:hypothetical protein
MLKEDNLDDDWGWFIHIDEEFPLKETAYMKRISMPCKNKEDLYVINNVIKKSESDGYFYFGCIISFVTYMLLRA